MLLKLRRHPNIIAVHDAFAAGPDRHPSPDCMLKSSAHPTNDRCTTPSRLARSGSTS